METNTKRKIIGSILFVVILIVILTLTFKVLKTTDKNIEIGALLPLSGNAAIYGQSMESGIELAVEEINKNRGINGKGLKITYEDSKGDPKTAVTTLSLMENIPVVITAISGVVLSTAPLANEKEIILLNVGAKSPLISEAGDYVFSNIPNSNYDEKLFVKFVKENLNINKIAIIHINNDYGVGTSKAFNKYFTESGGDILISETYETDATDFKTQLTKIKAKDPEAIFLVGLKEQGLVLKQAKELGINKRWLAPEGFAQPEIIKIAGGAAENVIFHTPNFDLRSQSEPTKSFVEDYKSRYSKDPDIYAANSYDATMLLATAIKEVGPNSQKIKDWLYNINNFQGVSGIIKFDFNGDVIKPILIKTIKNQQITEFN